MEYQLNQSHLQEVRKFVNFFEQKRKESLGEIQTAFAQFQEKKIKDDILSRVEVETLINELRDEVRTTMDSELQTLVYMSGVYIKILMSQAESHNLTLQGDVSFIENEKAIEEVRNLGNFERDLLKKTQGARLPTLSASSDPIILSRNKELTEENSNLKRKIIEQQTKITEILEELKKHKTGNEDTEDEIKEVSQVLEETKLELRTKEELISSLKQEQEKRLEESKQFQSLKKLIQSKNDQIKQLREEYFLYRINVLSNQISRKS